MDSLVIKCNAKDCFNIGEDGFCGYGSGCQIDIDKNGMCMDYDKVTEEERKKLEELNNG